MAGAATADVGTGCTITHGTTSYAAVITGISGEVSRTVVETTDMSTTGARTRRVGDLYDPGTLTIQTILDPEEEAPYTTAEETITVTFPIKAGDSTGATCVGSGAVSNFSWGAQVEELMTASYTVQFTDDLVWTDGSV